MEGQIGSWAMSVCRCFHPLSGLCGFYTFRISENQSNRCGHCNQHVAIITPCDSAQHRSCNHPQSSPQPSL